MRRIIIISFVFKALIGFSQSEAVIFLEGAESGKIQYSDSTSLIGSAREFVSGLWSEGFVFASLDSVSQDTVYVYRGSRVNFQPGQRSFSKKLSQARKQLNQKANSGYPFARIVWDSQNIGDGGLLPNYRIIEGPLILNDSIILLNPIKTKRSFLAKTIGFERGQPYSERSFQSFEKRLDRVTFLTSNRRPDVSFQSSKAWAYLDLKETNTGSFKGVVGLLPNQSSNSNTLITGSIDLRLENLFRTGKLLDLSWNRFGELSQKLDVAYEHPYLAGSDLSFEGRLHLMKQDSSFINQQFEVGARFFIKNQISLGASFEQENSSILLSDANQISMLNLLDYHQDRYIISLRQLVSNPAIFKDYFGFSTKLGVGQRTVNQIAGLPDSYYDSIQMKSTNVLVQVQTKIQRKLSKSSTLFHSLSGSYLSGSLSQNQQFRLGGLQTLRGFNEQFFFAEAFMVNQVEWRYFFEESSHFFVFADQGLVKNASWIYPIGIGGGFSITTNSGLFSFAMAVGQVEGVPFDLANMKVHFGYTSQF